MYRMCKWDYVRVIVVSLNIFDLLIALGIEKKLTLNHVVFVFRFIYVSHSVLILHVTFDAQPVRFHNAL